MILLIDNYDSFAHNLARYLRRLDQTVHVVRNDAISVEEVEQLDPAAVVLSPGPRTPDEAGICLDIVRRLCGCTPILGICLGHQAIVRGLGGDVIRARRPMHGRASEVFHDGQGVFDQLPNPLIGARYHSLVVGPETLPPDLAVSARTKDGEIMSVRHRSCLTVGLQFHPESVLTSHGFQLLAGFLRAADLRVPENMPAGEIRSANTRRQPEFETVTPVTF